MASPSFEYLSPATLAEEPPDELSLEGEPYLLHKLQAFQALDSLIVVGDEDAEEATEVDKKTELEAKGNLDSFSFKTPSNDRDPFSSLA